MKRFTWLLLALLLLIILCAWYHTSNIYNASRHNLSYTAKHATKAPQAKRQLHFEIRQKDKGHAGLSGLFANETQPQRLKEAFGKADSILSMSQARTQKSIEGDDEVIALVVALAPLFVQEFDKGIIRYRDGVLVVEGEAKDFDTKRKLQSILANSTVLSQDLSVVAPKEPIAFTIQKEAQQLRMSGTLQGVQQLEALEGATSTPFINKEVAYKANRVEKGEVTFVEKILPTFNQRFTKGKIVCKNGKIEITGYAKDESAIKALESFIAKAPVPVSSKLMLDPEELAKRKAEEEAKRKALEEAKRKAQEDARLKAELEAQQKAAQAKIQKLLEIENIEFIANKSKLTTKGLTTVEKLAEIMKKYPDTRIEIGGHTDSDGSEDFNLKLSQERVDSVKRALVERGIDAGRIVAKGYGESRPLVANNSDQNKQRNRRVEITILGE